MTTLRWNPAEELVSLRREMSRLIEDGWSPTGFTQIMQPEERVMRLPLDAYTTAEEIVMEDDVLTIKGGTPSPA